MVLTEAKEEWEVSDVLEFVKVFKLEKKFCKEFKIKKVDDWDFGECDEDIIRGYLEELNGTYDLEYVDDRNFGYFKIKLLEV